MTLEKSSLHTKVQKYSANLKGHLHHQTIIAMISQYWAGGLIMLICFLAFIFASRKQFYARRFSAGSYGQYLVRGMSGCLWIIIKIVSILLFLYGLAMVLQAKDAVSVLRRCQL